MTAGAPGQASATRPEGSSLAPFRSPPFTVLWIATVVSNVGVWMQNAAAGWLMTGLTTDPFVVSLVQVATSLPIFFLALPAGALADIVDRRRLLIAMQIAVTILVAAFGALVSAGRVTPNILLDFLFLAASAAAIVMPTWQSIVPQLVEPADLQPAVAMNSVGVNISRAIGPALAGLVIAAWGLASPYWVNAATTVGVIAALIWLRPAIDDDAGRLPPEHFYRAIAAGLRHARFNAPLRATLLRAVGFFLFGSAYWAMLPLLARKQIVGGPELYGLLLGTIGVGAVAAAFFLPMLKRRLGPDRTFAAGSFGTGLALLLFGLARQPAIALVASLIAGMSWISVLATLNVSAQVSLPGWVRGRGLSVFVAVMFASLTVGSAVWGKAAGGIGLPAAHFVAAAGVCLSVPLLWRWKLHTGARLDLTPSMHWPQPLPFQEIDSDRGPVLVTVEYHVSSTDRSAFLTALAKLAGERRRDGAFEWGVYEDIAEQGRFVETFMLDSWVDHLRQHRRVSNTDKELQHIVHAFNVGEPPKVTHLLAASS
jgi:MFS family permease